MEIVGYGWEPSIATKKSLHNPWFGFTLLLGGSVMKYLLSLALLGGLFSGDAKAFWGVLCSNGHGSIKYTDGREGSSVTWTEPQVNDRGHTLFVPVRRLIPGDFGPPDPVTDVEVTFEELREFEGESECRQGQGEWTWVSGWRDYLGKVTIVKKDGSSFPEGTSYLSEDGKTLSAHIICLGSYSLSGRVPCDAFSSENQDSP